VARMYDWEVKTFDGDDQKYMEALMPKDGHTVKVVAAQQEEMGMTAAATLSMKLIERYRPMYLIMPGIAAGTGEEKPEDQLYGDVVLADAVWNYSNGKYVSPGKGDITFGELGFEPRPSLVRITGDHIKTIIEYYTNNLSKNQIEILHLNMIEIYMIINKIVNNEDSLYMYEIMGNLLYVLLKNKLYYMKDLNNFIDKSDEMQIHIAKVVKFAILASGNSSKQYHNDFKFTKLFNNNDIFVDYVTKEIFKK
jgi:hypothetical protein